ncbi:UBX domain-containing protein [Trypanosoma equiperdum]|nr:UBX domain-containing protein [Trypanosoma equiperdum]
MDEDVVQIFMAMCDCSETVAISLLSEANFDVDYAYHLHMSRTQGADESVTSLHGTSPQGEAPHLQEPELPHASYVVNRLDGGGGYVGGNYPHERDFLLDEVESEQDLLDSVFPIPAFVHRSPEPFDTFCTDSLNRDQWVILSFVLNDFTGFCVNRDIWRSEDLLEVLSMFSIYQTTADVGEGPGLAHGYRLDVEKDIPTLLIINPITRVKETRIPINVHEATIESYEVKNALLTFVGEKGSPNQWEECRLRGTYENASPVLHTENSREYVDVEETSIPFSEPEAGRRDEANEGVVAQPPQILAVDISPYEVPAEVGSAFTLRCRLPKEQLTLRLKPEMPVLLLLKYLSTRLYFSQSTAFPGGVPNCSLRVGFPPKDLIVEDGEVQLGTCPGLRSGDTVVLHIH